MVATDAISAFDFVLDTPIPDKGVVLTQLSQWWFSQIDFPNHVVSGDVPAEYAGRGVIVDEAGQFLGTVRASDLVALLEADRHSA